MELFQLYDHSLSSKMPKQEVYIPDDVVTNILNRLPSTSILGFQAVSKYWCYAICSNIFKTRSKSSLMSVQFTNVAFNELTLFNFDDEGKTIRNVCDIDLGGTVNYRFSNMVNGLVCAYGDETATSFYLINLTTFETSKYPSRKIKDTAYYDKVILGFNPSTGLYKFIRIYSLFGNYGSYHCEILENSASFEHEWKTIGVVPLMVNIDNPVYLDGAIHWMMKPRSSYKRKPLAFDILKLDMAKERFEMIAPILENEFDDCDCQICDFTLSGEKGKLYVLHYCPERKCLEGWRLKESKRDRVWNSLFHVNFASMIDKEGGGLIGNDEHPSLVATDIVDDKVLIRSKRFNEGVCIWHDKGVYIYDLVHKKLTECWNVYSGSFSLKHGWRRILFHRSE